MRKKAEECSAEASGRKMRFQRSPRNIDPNIASSWNPLERPFSNFMRGHLLKQNPVLTTAPPWRMFTSRPVQTGAKNNFQSIRSQEACNRSTNPFSLKNTEPDRMLFPSVVALFMGSLLPVDHKDLAAGSNLGE